ncbi:hypothetical protein BLOT_000885 [Blomia tropicalis]|nr:hypothetical protein BLOT_000885 [Blomia tropicalis]
MKNVIKLIMWLNDNYTTIPLIWYDAIDPLSLMLEHENANTTIDTIRCGLKSITILALVVIFSTATELR